MPETAENFSASHKTVSVRAQQVTKIPIQLGIDRTQRVKGCLYASYVNV